MGAVSRNPKRNYQCISFQLETEYKTLGIKRVLTDHCSTTLILQKQRKSEAREEMTTDGLQRCPYAEPLPVCMIFAHCF